MRLGEGLVLASVLIFACGDGKGGDGDEEGTETGGDACATNDGHGTVRIELQRSPQEVQTPFMGTAFIVVFLDFKECLTDFYTTHHPEYQQEGVEGASVFQTWAEGRLCDASCYDDPIVSCTVTDMVQIINTQGQMDTTRLVITYEIADDEIEGLQLPVGPFPTEELTGCSPLVQLTGASVQGKDANMNTIWQIASFENATARVGQGAPIQIFAERPG
jgi:hypothetical protein